MAIKALLANKMRSLLTMLGVIIGVAAVIALVSVGMGVRTGITSNFESLLAKRMLETEEENIKEMSAFL